MSEPGRDRVYLLIAALGLLAALIIGWRLLLDVDPGLGDEPEAGEAIAERGGAGAPTPGLRGRGGPSWPDPAAKSDEERLSIRARIIDPDVGPLQEGRVELHCLDGALQAARTLDEEGRFEAPACAEGPTCVRLVHPGVEQPRAWELDPGGELELEVAAAPRIAGTILGVDGEPLAGAELMIRREPDTQITGVSDAAGEFALALPRLRACDRCDASDDASGEAASCRTEAEADASAVTLLARAPEHAPTQLELAPSDEPIELRLPAAAPALRGIVRGREGRPFDARTRVLASNRAREHEQHAAPVDEQGRFSFTGLAEGSYSLRAIRDEREIASLPAARPGERVELRSELAARGSALIVEIVDAEGQPRAGARVDGGPLRAAISDAEGRVRADAVLPGRYLVRVRASGCGPIREALELGDETGPWTRRASLPAGC